MWPKLSTAKVDSLLLTPHFTTPHFRAPHFTTLWYLIPPQIPPQTQTLTRYHQRLPWHCYPATNTIGEYDCLWHRHRHRSWGRSFATLSSDVSLLTELTQPREKTVASGQWCWRPPELTQTQPQTLASSSGPVLTTWHSPCDSHYYAQHSSPATSPSYPHHIDTAARPPCQQRLRCHHVATTSCRLSFHCCCLVV